MMAATMPPNNKGVALRRPYPPPPLSDAERLALLDEAIPALSGYFERLVGAFRLLNAHHADTHHAETPLDQTGGEVGDGWTAVRGARSYLEWLGCAGALLAPLAGGPGAGEELPR